MSIPKELKELADNAKAHKPAEVEVRTLLSWFGAYRRSWRNVERIREALAEAGVITFPDFEGEYLYGTVNLMLKEDVSSPAANKDNQGGATPNTESSHRISRLKSANTPPVSVTPDSTVQSAITLMLYNDYSQLPVLQSPRDAKGVISWRSLGARLVMENQCTYVRDCMDKHKEISLEDSLFDAVQIIAEEDCVLVRAKDKTICGIVTAYDIGVQFQQLAEPFLLLGDIENHMRRLISGAFSTDELQQVKASHDEGQEIANVSDLTMGQYVRLLEAPQNWDKLHMKIDRKQFIAWLDKVREIRNDVMHFDPDPIDPKPLKAFAQFLRTYDDLVVLSTPLPNA